jgi:6,7-dimethyl-8-ribityllumazine synthase
MQQAMERAGIKANLGWEYAMSALEMASLMQQIKRGPNNGSTPNSLASAAVQSSLPAMRPDAVNS